MEGHRTRMMTDRRDTDADHLSIWTANLAWKGNLDCSVYNSDAFFQRLRQYSYRPDILMINEMPYCSRSECSHVACFDHGSDPASHAEFMDRLQHDPLDAEYDYVHAAGPPEDAPNSDHMVVFRKDRFTLADEDVLVWKEVAGSTCDADDSRGRWQMAVRLWDQLQAQYVVAVSVHFSYTFHCVRENLLYMQRRLDARWDPTEGSPRDLVVVGGDFNQAPDTTSDKPRWRAETDPDPWYRTMSEAYDGPLRYHDTAWTKHHAERGIRSNPICAEWTHGNTIRLDENAPDRCDYVCDDSSSDPTEVRCNSHPRIDFLWVRWEAADGTVMTSDTTAGFDPEAWIETAMADQGYFGSMIRARGKGLYSDHRAVHAVLRWR